MEQADFPPRTVDWWESRRCIDKLQPRLFSGYLWNVMRLRSHADGADRDEEENKVFRPDVIS